MVIPAFPNSQQWTEHLQQRRQERGLSVRQLAEILKVNPAYVSLVENGKKIPDSETAGKWAEALGEDPRTYLAWVRSWRERDPSVTSRSYAEYEALRANPDSQVTVAHTTQVKFEQAAPEGRTSKGGPLRVPLLPTGADPDSGAEPLEWITVEQELLESVERPRDPFAYRVTSFEAMRVSRTIRPGDYAVLTRRVMPLEPGEIYGVKSAGRVVLSRIVLKGDRLLVLLSDRDSQQIEVVQSEKENAQSLIVGKVLVIIRPSQYTVVSPSGRAARK